MKLSEFGVSVTLDATSLKVAADNLKKLPRSVAEKIEKTILKKAMQPVYDETIRRVPVGATGNLAKGIKLQVKKAGTLFYANVLSTAPHSHLVEFGHKIVTKKTGKRRSKTPDGYIDKDYPERKVRVPPHPFLRPSFNAHAEKILKICEDEILKALEKHSK